MDLNIEFFDQVNCNYRHAIVSFDWVDYNGNLKLIDHKIFIDNEIQPTSDYDFSLLIGRDKYNKWLEDVYNSARIKLQEGGDFLGL